MKCSNCGGNIIDNCCLKCGRLTNGNVINESNIEDKYYLQKKFNKNFDSMYRNDKIYLPFLLGPLYFTYRGCVIIGTILILLDFCFTAFLFESMDKIIQNPPVTFIFKFVYLVFNRIMYSIFSNTLCLSIDNLKIKYIKKRYKKYYLKKIEKYKHKDYSFVLTLLFYFVVLLIIIFIKRYKNGLL